MKKTLIITILTIAALALSACGNNMEKRPNDNAALPSVSPVLESSASPAQPTNTVSTEKASKLVPFSTVSPDKKMRVEWTADDANANVGKLTLIDVENAKTVIAYDYPLETEFTAIWNKDGGYCALGYKNNEETCTAILIAKADSSNVGKMIYSGELSKFTDSAHPDKADAHILPLEFKDESTLILFIDWIDKDGNQNSAKTQWDFEHGTYTKLEKLEN